jgi:hypothetical protein
MTWVGRAVVGPVAAVMATLIGSLASAQPETPEKTKDSAMIACMYASMAMESVAEQLAFRKDAVASVEGRRAFIQEVEMLFGSLIASTADLQAVTLSSFDAGLKSYESIQKVRGATGVSEADFAKLEKRSWIEAAREVERICLFRLGEISGQGRLDEAIRRR